MQAIEKMILAGLLVAALPVQADESDWRTSADATLYTYANRMALRNDSVLNPRNQIARLPQAGEVAELRAGFKVVSETVRITGRFIGSTREMRNGFGKSSRSEGYASLWQVRVRAAEDWNVAAGRDVLNWGAGQFRSPSSPFHFDNGRTDPMRELVGMDVAKVTWTPDMQSSTTVARVVRSGYGAAQPDAWRDSWLAKFDTRGDEIAWGAVAAKAPHLGAFYGAHGQYTMSDELMLYGEFGSSVLPMALDSPDDAAQPYVLQSPAPRRNAVLAGSSYTFESGQSLMLEYLHDGHGYTASGADAYFARAGGALPLAGMALGHAPRLLGRDYMHLVWQSNLMESSGYWRMMTTRNLTSGSSELGGYGEAALNGHITVFVMGVWNNGSARQELSSLFTRSIALGLKVALN